MKFSFSTSLKRASALAALGLFTGLPITAHAVTYDWNGGNGTWDLDPLNTAWNANTAPWTNDAGTNVARFLTGTGTVSFGSFAPGGTLEVGQIEFGSTVGSYTFDNQSSPTVINLNGTGIVQDPLSPAQVVLSDGTINFKNSATAGDSRISVSGAGIVNFLNSSTAGSPTSGAVISNGGSVTFSGSSNGGKASVNNEYGTLALEGGSTTGGLTVTNGGFIESLNHTGAAYLGTVSNSALSGGAGSINVGSNELHINNLTLATGQGTNALSFVLSTPNTGGPTYLGPDLISAGVPSSGQGRIVVDGLLASFASTADFHGVEISLSSFNNGLVPGGTYTLIDWTTATNSGVDPTDFTLVGSLPPNVSAENLQLIGLPGSYTGLALVVVPEPATFAMPLAACMGLLILRRRASRMAVGV